MPWNLAIIFLIGIAFIFAGATTIFVHLWREWTRDLERRIPYTVLNEHRRTVTLPYAQKDFKP
jgi:hypothetical protein